VIGGLLAAGGPSAFYLVREMLAEEAGDMLAGRREAVVER
jgi:hypothetical protein